MRKSLYILILVILAGGVVLTLYSPDVLSLLFILIMVGIIVAAILGGVLPVLRYDQALERGLESIDRAMEVQTSSTWSAILGYEGFFGQRVLDQFFDEYRNKVKGQQESGQVLCDIDEYINEDSCCSARSGSGQSLSYAQALPAPSERSQCTRQGNSCRCPHRPRGTALGPLSAWPATALHSGVHDTSEGCAHCRFQRSSPALPGQKIPRFSAAAQDRCAFAG